MIATFIMLVVVGTIIWYCETRDEAEGTFEIERNGDDLVIVGKRLARKKETYRPKVYYVHYLTYSVFLTEDSLEYIYVYEKTRYRDMMGEKDNKTREVSYERLGTDLDEVLRFLKEKNPALYLKMGGKPIPETLR